MSVPLYARAATLFPETHIYPAYLADPTRVTFNTQLMYFSKTTVAETSDQRFDLKIGAPLPLYESEFGDKPWQLVLIAGFHHQFDPEHSQDNIGWDGIYGLHVAGRVDNSWAWRIGTKHISSHVGDEYIERTGRQRINYTREELRVGMAWTKDNKMMLYGDVARAFDMRNKELQKPWRAQLGAQYDSPTIIWLNQITWFTALDVSSYEESDWDLNVTYQIGLATKSGIRTWRLGLEWYGGRMQIGEFFQDEEQYLSIGLWFDL